MDLFTFLLCKKKGGGGGGLTYTLSADTVNKQIVLTPSEGDAQAITVPYATDASTVNGKDVPELENGKIPATYLPSYVDDVLEYEDLAHFPAEGEIGKIYIALDTSLIYRWSGSTYAEISQSLALGETEATAYRGDRGKIAYDHSQSAHAPSNAEANQNAFSNITVGDTTIEADSKTDTLTLEAGSNITLTPDASADKVTITATDTTYSDATTSASGLMSGSDKTKLNGIATGAEVNQNAFSNVKIGSTTVAADSKTDILELEAGDNIELTPDSTNDKITISGIPVTRTIRDVNIASFSDGSNAPIPSLTASIVPVQAGSGDPSPTNVRPISGWTEEVIKVCGKNWFNINDISSYTNMELVDGVLRNTVADSKTSPALSIQLWNGSTYITEYNIPNTSTTGRKSVTLPITRAITRLRFKHNGSTNDIGIWFDWDRQGTYTFSFDLTGVAPNVVGGFSMTDIQLEEGSTATTYEPYAGTTTTIPFTDSQGNPVEVYGGSVDVVNGGEQPSKFVKIELQDVTPNYWTKSSTYAGGFYFNCNLLGIKTNIPFMCSHAKTVNSVSEYVSGTCFCDNSVNIRIMDGSATVNDWIDYLNDQKQANRPVTICAEIATPTTFYTQPTSIKSINGENNVFASTGPLREVTYRTQAYGDFIATRDLPDAISDIKTLKLDENQILIGDGNFNKIGLFMDDYYDENLDTTFTTEVTPQEIYLTSQPAESVNQTTIISGDRTEYQTSLLSGTEVINTVNAIGMEVNVKENGSITHGIKIVSGDIRLLGSDTWDGTNISLKDALAAIQNNLYIANYNKTASLSSGSNTVALDMIGYTYNGNDIVNVYVDGLYKINNTDYTITVNDSTGVASINYTAAAAGTMAIQVIKPKIGFTALTDNNGDNVTDNSGNSIDI